MKKFLAIAITVLALAGCSSAGPATKSDDGVVSNGSGAISVTYYEVSRPDGSTVPCVVAVGYYKAGLSCDWGSE